jgi:hypothetical protein
VFEKIDRSLGLGKQVSSGFVISEVIQAEVQIRLILPHISQFTIKNQSIGNHQVIINPLTVQLLITKQYPLRFYSLLSILARNLACLPRPCKTLDTKKTLKGHTLNQRHKSAAAITIIREG